MVIAPCPIAGHYRKESGTNLWAPAVEELVCNAEISFSVFSRLKQAQLPPSLLTREMLQASHHLCGLTGPAPVAPCLSPEQPLPRRRARCPGWLPPAAESRRGVFGALLWSGGQEGSGREWVWAGV